VDILLNADGRWLPRHHPPDRAHRSPRYGSQRRSSAFCCCWLTEEHIRPSFVVYRISYSSPPPSPSHPDIPQDSLSAFWTDHNVNRQPELMGRRARRSNGEGLDRSRNLTTQDSLA